MKKCGMTYEGTLRQAQKCNSGVTDMVVYAILAEEYRPAKTAAGRCSEQQAAQGMNP